MDRHALELLQSAVQRADEQWRSGNAKSALLSYCDIFSQRWSQLGKNSAELTAADLRILEQIADLCVPFGLAEQSASLLESAAEGYGRLHNPYWHDLITLKRIHVCFSEHQPLRARELFRELHSPFDAVETTSLSPHFFAELETSYNRDTDAEPRRTLLTEFYLQVGGLLLYLGRYDAAISVLQRGREYSAGGAETHNAELHFRLGLARALLERGDLGIAEDQLSEISPRIDQARFPGHATTWLVLAARLDLLRGDFGTARERVTQVWNVCAANGFARPALRSLLNVADMLILVNRTVEAQQILVLLRAYATELQDVGLEGEIELLSNVAELRVGLNTPALPSVSQMQDDDGNGGLKDPHVSRFRVSSDGRSLDDFDLRALQFHYYLGSRNWNATRRCLARMEGFSRSDSRIIRSRLKVLQGMFAYYQGEPQQAYPQLTEAVRDLRVLGLVPERWQAQVVCAKCLDKLNAPMEERERLERENYALLETLTDSLPLHDRVTYLLNKPTIEEEEIARQIRTMQHMQEHAGVGWLARVRRTYALQKGLNEVLNLIFRQKQAIADKHLGAAADQPWPRTSLWKRLFLRSPYSASMCFVVLPDSVFCVTLAWGQMRFLVTQCTRLRVRQLVASWHQTVPQSRPDEASRLANTLTRELEVERLLGNLPERVRRLTVIPDDALHGFPFSVLKIEGRFLFERFCVSVGFQPEGPAQLFRQLQAVGEPLLVGITKGSPPLPKTLPQIQLLETWFAARRMPTTTLLDENVTPQKLEEKLQASGLLHLSCHGEFSPDNAEQTGWQLLRPEGDTQIFGFVAVESAQSAAHATRHSSLLLGCRQLCPPRALDRQPARDSVAGRDRQCSSLFMAGF